MKAYCVVTVGIQIDGELVTVVFEKATTSKEAAEEHAKKLAQNFKEVKKTPQGDIELACLRGVYEIEVENG